MKISEINKLDESTPDEVRTFDRDAIGVISTYKWFIREKAVLRDVYRGKGAWNAYKAGAFARLRLDHRMYHNKGYYKRSDCVTAFLQGYRDIDSAIRRGMIFKCSYCGSKIGEGRHEDDF